MYTIGSVYSLVMQKKGYKMEDMIEEIIFEIIKTSDPRDAAAIVTNVIYDVQDGNDIMESIDKNCEVMFE